MSHPFNQKEKTMAKAYVFLADGFEIIEALAPIDILRRGGIEVTTVSIMQRREVVASKDLPVIADTLFEEVGSFDDADLLALPGGWPGADNLNKFQPLRQLLLEHHAKGKRIGAICAAPMVLGSLGLLKGHKATCFPGFEQHLEGCDITHDLVTVDGQITTAEGPAAALPYGFTLLSHFRSPEEVDEQKEVMRYKHLMEG